jgi:hypothetical protein
MAHSDGHRRRSGRDELLDGRLDTSASRAELGSCATSSDLRGSVAPVARLSPDRMTPGGSDQGNSALTSRSPTSSASSVRGHVEVEGKDGDPLAGWPRRLPGSPGRRPHGAGRSSPGMARPRSPRDPSAQAQDRQEAAQTPKTAAYSPILCSTVRATLLQARCRRLGLLQAEQSRQFVERAPVARRRLRAAPARRCRRCSRSRASPPRQPLGHRMACPRPRSKRRARLRSWPPRAGTGRVPACRWRPSTQRTGHAPGRDGRDR